jgi:uncharacterized membrane protein
MARRRDDKTLVTAAALGALSGIRSMAAPSLVARALADGRTPLPGRLASPTTARLLSLAAAGEMLADKSPWIPDRTSTLPLVGRAVLGSLSATALAYHRGHRPLLLHGAVGAAAALAATFAAFHVRRLAVAELKAPDRLVGLLEDAVVTAASRRMMQGLSEP